VVKDLRVLEHAGFFFAYADMACRKHQRLTRWISPIQCYDLALPDRFDVYYGMADNRIGVARMDVPEFLPQGALADLPRAKGSLQIDGRSQTKSRQFV
jgi:hypothetical protein